jgi:hypothetical protein
MLIFCLFIIINHSHSKGNLQRACDQIACQQGRIFLNEGGRIGDDFAAVPKVAIWGWRKIPESPLKNKKIVIKIAGGKDKVVFNIKCS